MAALSRVGLGTAPLGSRVDGPLWWGPQDPADAVAAVRAALDAGVDWIDTAPFYGWGLAEELVGRAVAGRRDEVRILTKCGTVRGPDGRTAEDASPAAIRAGLRDSLRRLGTDHVDVLQVHDPDPATPVEETWAAIAELVTGGLVRAGGLSNHPVELMERAHAVAPVPVVQHQYSLLHRAPEADGVLNWCAAHGSAFLAWSPLASGSSSAGSTLPRSSRTTCATGCPGRVGTWPDPSAGSPRSPRGTASRRTGSRWPGPPGGPARTRSSAPGRRPSPPTCSRSPT